MPELAPELAPELIPELDPPPELPLEEPPLELMPELDIPLESVSELLPPLLDWLGIESVVPLLDADGLPGPDEREYRESLVVTQVRVGVPLGPVV